MADVVNSHEIILPRKASNWDLSRRMQHNQSPALSCHESSMRAACIFSSCLHSMCTPKPLYHDHHAKDASHIQRLKEPKNRRKINGHLPAALPLYAHPTRHHSFTTLNCPSPPLFRSIPLTGFPIPPACLLVSLRCPLWISDLPASRIA